MRHHSSVASNKYLWRRGAGAGAGKTYRGEKGAAEKRDIKRVAAAAAAGGGSCKTAA